MAVKASAQRVPDTYLKLVKRFPLIHIRDEAHLDEALELLGIDDGQAESIGIAFYKLAMIWPIEPEGLRAFADGLDSLIVIEEKGPFIASQVRNLLYGLDSPPRIDCISVGGQEYLPDDGVMSPEFIAHRLGGMLSDSSGDDTLRDRANWFGQELQVSRAAPPPVISKPHFSPGCPHSTSTALPPGSRASSGRTISTADLG